MSRTQSVPVVTPVTAAPVEGSFLKVAEPEVVTSSTNILEPIPDSELGILFEATEAPIVEAPRFATEDELSSVTTYTVTLNTGESVEISSSALLGRMPQPAEGELFEHLIVVTDPGRSVSKTHLEFGVREGELWISDRNSGNGSIIREPGVVPRRAQPGTHYVVSRGTRVDIGDLFLTIS